MVKAFSMSGKRHNTHFLILTTFLVFLVCMSPRYISTLKIRIGINLSYFDITMVFAWALFAKKKAIISYESVFILIWLIQIIISVWRAEQINLWGYYVLYVSEMLLFMMFIMYFDRDKIDKYIINGFLIGLTVHLLIGFYEIMAKHYLFEVGTFSRKYMHTTGISIFHNPNDYSMFVVVLLPFAVHKFVDNLKRKKIAVLYGFLIAGSIYFSIVNKSRVAVLCLTVLIVYCVKQILKTRKHKYIISFLLIISLSLTLLIPNVMEWLLSVVADNSFNTASRADLVRLNLIRNGLYFLEQTNGMGVGAGNLYDWLSFKSIYYIENIRYMHNWYIELLATFGIVLFVLYVIFHFRILRHLYIEQKESDNAFGITRAMFLSFVFFTITSVSSSTNVYSEWVWIYLGWMAVKNIGSVS